MPQSSSEAALDQLFREARSFRPFLDKDVSEQQIVAVWELIKMGATSANQLPARLVWCHSPEARERLERQVQAMRNSSLQGAYLILAARALGLDCGPMSGFDNTAVDADCFADEPRWRSNFICSAGYGDRSSIFLRSPRPEIDQFNRLL